VASLGEVARRRGPVRLRQGPRLAVDPVLSPLPSSPGSPTQAPPHALDSSALFVSGMRFDLSAVATHLGDREWATCPVLRALAEEGGVDIAVLTRMQGV
jgi:hypothetical protein